MGNFDGCKVIFIQLTYDKICNKMGNFDGWRVIFSSL